MLWEFWKTWSQFVIQQFMLRIKDHIGTCIFLQLWAKSNDIRNWWYTQSMQHFSLAWMVFSVSLMQIPILEPVLFCATFYTSWQLPLHYIYIVPHDVHPLAEFQVIFSIGLSKWRRQLVPMVHSQPNFPIYWGKWYVSHMLVPNGLDRMLVPKKERKRNKLI